VDILEADDNRVIGASLAVDRYVKVHITYGGKKTGAYGCYYITNQGGSWQTPISMGISQHPSEPLVPFIEIERYIIGGQPQDSIRTVYNIDTKVYYTSRLDNEPYDQWNTPEQVSEPCNSNYLPQIDGSFVTWTRENLDQSLDVYGRHWPDGDNLGEFPICNYGENSYSCHVTKVGESAAAMYGYGNPAGPRWQVFYMGPDGFGGNTESDGPVSLGTFSLSIPRTIVNGNAFSISTTGACNVDVFDASGRRITELKVERGGLVESSIKCDRWPSGVYFVRAVRDDMVRKGKVVVVR
jgi:hypothetical protein